MKKSISHRWLKPRALTQLFLIASPPSPVLQFAGLIGMINMCSKESQENILKMLKMIDALRKHPSQKFHHNSSKKKKE